MGDKAQGAEIGPGSARFLLRTFKRILDCNTRVLERMARMDRALSGEYVFDNAFLESAVRDVCALTHRTVYHLNGMSAESHVGLYDRFLVVKDTLERILAEPPGDDADAGDDTGGSAAKPSALSTGSAGNGPVTPVEAALADTCEDFPEPEDILAEGGQIACGGVAAGPLMHLDEETSPESVPVGAVGLVYAATPALSRIVPRLGALLAEVGTAASHLATVTREYRVPALFGVKGLFDLPPETMVTVDANGSAVYRGVVEGLLRRAAQEEIRVDAEPEYITLRHLLRHIRPLSLIDPKDKNFTPAHCRTCHDIIHFVHEKSVERLLSIDTSDRSGLRAPRRFKGQSPISLSIVDLDDGLTGIKPGTKTAVTIEHIASLPLRAFLTGFMDPAAQRMAPANLSMRDIASGMSRTSQLMSASPETIGQNLAMAAKDYANITLRLGYHFSVVDALVSDRPEHTFIYFRFAGGFADDARRARRATLIFAALARLGFRSSRQGDLVVGKRKVMEASEALEVLRLLGALSAYTRQLDVELTSEEEAERFAQTFFELFDVRELLPGTRHKRSIDPESTSLTDEASGSGADKEKA